MKMFPHLKSNHPKSRTASAAQDPAAPKDTFASRVQEEDPGDRTAARTTESSTLHSVRQFYKYKKPVSRNERIYVAIVTAAALLLLVFLCCRFFLLCCNRDLKEKEQNLALTLDTLVQRNQSSSGLSESNAVFLQELLQKRLLLENYYLEDVPGNDRKTAIQALAGEGDVCEFYYYIKEFPVFESSNAKGLALSSEQLQELFKNGSLTQTVLVSPEENNPGLAGDSGLLEGDSGIGEMPADAGVPAADLSTAATEVLPAALTEAPDADGTEGRTGPAGDVSKSVTEYYAAVPYAAGHLIALIKDTGADIPDAGSAYGITQPFMDTDTLIYNTETGEILFSTIRGQTGQNALALPLILQGTDIAAAPLTEIGLADILRGQESWRYLTSQLSDSVTAAVFFSEKEAVSDTAANVTLPILLFFLVSLCLIIYGAAGRLIRWQVRGTEEVLRLREGLYLDRLFIRRTLALFVICAVLMASISSFISLLNDLSTENITADTNMSRLIQEESYNLQQAERIRNYRDRNLSALLDQAAEMSDGSESFRSTEQLAAMAEILGASDITIFNGSGVAVSSSTGYTGYTLNQLDEDGVSMSPAWKVLQSELSSQLVSLDADTGRSYYYVKFRYDPGMVRFEITNTAFQEQLSYLGLRSLLLQANFGSSDLLFYDSAQPQRLVRAASGAHDVEILSNTLTESKLHDGYFGIDSLRGRQYYVNIMADSNRDSAFFISARRTRDLFNSIFRNFTWLMGRYMLLTLLILVLYSVCRISPDRLLDVRKLKERLDIEEDAALIAEDDTPEIILAKTRARIYDTADSLLDRLFVFFVKFACIASVAALVLFFAADLARNSNQNSLLWYLFLSGREKSFNLFSVTAILMLAIVIWGFSLLLRELTKLISDNMGPAGLTIGRLIMSVIRFAALIAIILITLSELGVNTATILASAGLTSVVIGIGAQSTVSNILSGLFIIFEGKFHVGDIVSIDGWTGRITEIGVRTTCIESYGLFSDYKNLRVINNSDFNNVVNLSRRISQAQALIPVSYDTDMALVEQLFHDNAALIRSRLPEIEDGPYYDGVVRLDSSAKVLRFRVKCQEAFRTYLERRLLQMTLEMLENGGVKIPFDQLVVHMDTKEVRCQACSRI